MILGILLRKISRILLALLMVSALYSFDQVNANSTGVAKVAWFEGDNVILYVNVSNVGETTIVETIFSLGTLNQKGTYFIVDSIDSEEIILPGETYTWVLNWNSSGAPLGVYDLHMVGVVYFDTGESQDIYAEEFNSFVLVRMGPGEAEVQLYYSFVDLPLVGSNYFLGQGVDICFDLNNSGNVPFFPEYDFRISPMGESNWTSIGLCREDNMTDFGISDYCYNEGIPLNTTPGLYDWEFHVIGYGGNQIRDYVYKSSEPFVLETPDPDCYYEFTLPSEPVTIEIFDFDLFIDNTGNVPYVLEIEIYLEDSNETMFYPDLLWEPYQIIFPGMSECTSYWLLPDNIPAGTYTCHSSLECFAVWQYDNETLACLDADNMTYCTQELPTDASYWTSAPGSEDLELFNYEVYLEDNDFYTFTVEAPSLVLTIEEPELYLDIDSVLLVPPSVGDEIFEMEIDWSSDGNLPCLPVFEISVDQGYTVIFDDAFYSLEVLNPGTHTLELNIQLPSDIQPGEYTGEINLRGFGIPDVPLDFEIDWGDLPIDKPGIYMSQIPIPTEADDIKDFVKIIDYNIYWKKSEAMYSFSFNVEQEDNSDDNADNNQGGIPGYPIEAVILSLFVVIYWINKKQ